MGLFNKRLLVFCVLAGMASAMMHENTHYDHETCAQTHEHHDHHDHDHHPNPDDSEDHETTPHHHHCCQFPVADRPSIDRCSLATFHGRLLKISIETSLIPDEPFFSLDKPPLI